MRSRRLQLRQIHAAALCATVIGSLLAALTVGCASTQSGGATQPTSQPSLATITTQVDSSIDVAVNLLTVGIETGVLPKSEYNANIDPIVKAMNAGRQQLEAAANAGDQTTWQAAYNAVSASLLQLQPTLQKIQSAQAAKAK